MATTEPRLYLTADGGGRVETNRHPETGERVWSCTSCETTGQGETEGREHAANCRTSGSFLNLNDHFFN